MFFSLLLFIKLFKEQLSGTPRETRAKKKVDVRFFNFFFIFIQVQVEKSLSLPGKKIKKFILIDMAKNRKKRLFKLL